MLVADVRLLVGQREQFAPVVALDVFELVRPEGGHRFAVVSRGVEVGIGLQVLVEMGDPSLTDGDVRAVPPKVDAAELLVGDAEMLGDCPGHVDVLDDGVRGMVDAIDTVDDHRDVRQVVVEHQVVPQDSLFAKQVAMVGRDHEQRLPVDAPLDVVEESADELVGVGDLGVVHRLERRPLVLGEVGTVGDVLDHVVATGVRVEREFERLVRREGRLVGEAVDPFFRRRVREVWVRTVGVEEKRVRTRRERPEPPLQRLQHDVRLVVFVRIHREAGTVRP